MSPSELPNFFVIGAAKCGTTSLANALRRHDEIFVPELKETLHFSNDELYARGLADYSERHFSGSGAFAARGEATPHYLAFEKAALRIRESLPPSSHRFIAIFRDPVTRAYSHYWNMVHEGQEQLDFEEALERETERLAAPDLETRGSLSYRYFECGLYARQLRIWLRHFERERFLLLLQDDLSRDPRAVMERVCRFLGVDPDFDPVSERANPAGLPRSARLQRFLRQPHWLKEPLKRLLSEGARQRLTAGVLRLNKRVAPYPPMRPETEALLRERYRADVEALQQLAGLDLRSWLSS